MSELAPQLSLVTSEEYRQWKSDTLATQSHITEICQDQEAAEKTKVSYNLDTECLSTLKIFYQDPILHLDKRGDKGNFKIEVADGYRFNPLGPISATWSCPQWQGC